MADELGTALLRLARGAIAQRLGRAAPPPDWLPALGEPGATFVTLTREGALRGCIGSLEAHQPLQDDVRQNALAAAFRDPRFPPLAAAEYDAVRVEVSLLSVPQPLRFDDEADALGQLRPGIDGLILSCEGRRATFLPQVWEGLPDPARFLAHLKRKAGLAEDYWSAAMTLARYEVQKWKEPWPARNP